jgi:epoxyqueuosine reductase QueG
MMASLTEDVINFLMAEDACAAGIATTETLAGGPESVDLEYVLPGAKSAVSFAVPMNQDLMMPYLSKKERRPYQHEHLHMTALTSGMAFLLSKYLEQRGYPSAPIASNNVWRADASPAGANDLLPDISQRYLAVASGVAQFGLSGNVLTKEHGAAIILGGIVTTAELEPTDPLPDEENYCDGCRLCMASCSASLMDPEEETTVKLGNKEHTYSMRRSYHRCELVCGGFSGLHPSGKWSTWSPGRFEIPKEDDEFMPALINAAMAYRQRPETEGGFLNHLIDKKLGMTCGCCQIVCVPDKEERKRRYKALTESGCVVQNPDGSLEAMLPEEAAERVAAMDPETRALYEQV